LPGESHRGSARIPAQIYAPFIPTFSGSSTPVGKAVPQHGEVLRGGRAASGEAGPGFAARLYEIAADSRNRRLRAAPDRL
jgi:hypothetical protein